jgi:hypothetical protein
VFDSIQAMSLLTIMEIVGPVLLLPRMPGIRRRRDETFGSSDMEASGGRADRGCQADDSPWRCLLGH